MIAACLPPFPGSCDDPHTLIASWDVSCHSLTVSCHRVPQVIGGGDGAAMKLPGGMAGR